MSGEWGYGFAVGLLLGVTVGIAFLAACMAWDREARS